MKKILSITLLFGFFAFLPNALADGENGLFIKTPSNAQIPNGKAMLTLNAPNIQVQAKWEVDGDNTPFGITDNGELYLTATVNDPATMVVTVIVQDMFSDLNTAYENLAVTALITVEFISGTLRIINPSTRGLLIAAGVGGTLALQTSGGEGDKTFRIYSSSNYFTVDETSGVLSVAASVEAGQYMMIIEVQDEMVAVSITVMATVKTAQNLALEDTPPLTINAGTVNILTSADAPLLITVGKILPLYTLQANGGLGMITYALMGDHSGYFALNKNSGVLQMNDNIPAGIYELPVVAWDAAIIPHRATATVDIAVTVVTIKKELTYLTLQAKVSDRPMTVHAFTLASAYSVLVADSQNYLAFDETSGAIWAKAWTPPGNYTLIIGVTFIYPVDAPPDEIAYVVVVQITNPPAPTKRKIYVLGGHDGNYQNDVWSSVNGKNYSLEMNAAGWLGRFDHQAVSHNGQIYVMGGYNNYYLNDVWSLVDGVNWSLETNAAKWTKRRDHQAISHNGRLYVLGGYRYYSNSSSYIYYRDVWSSINGKNWSLETNAAGWSGRYSHQAVSHNGRIYVLGGYSGGYKNDVWSSADGANWSLETNAAEWSRRSNHQAVSHNGRIYVLGGNYGSRKNDVWSSADGVNWSLETNAANWTERRDHQAVSYNGRLYVLGGNDGSRKNDVWSSANGANWLLETNVADWDARDDHQVVVFPAGLKLALFGVNKLTAPIGYSKLIATLTASNGLGNYTYTILSSNSSFYIKNNGELWANGTATEGEHIITVQVTDGTDTPATWTGKVTIICPKGCTS